MKIKIFPGLFLILIFFTAGAQQYPFQDVNLPVEERIDNILSLMTLDEKVACLSTNPEVPRLGIKGSSHVEGLHGVARGGPSNWGQRDPIPTTIFPQAIGLAETWDTAMIRKVAAIEGYEARYIFQNGNYKRGSIVVRAPNADLGRDPRWGRTEECYGEDPFLTAAMTVSFIKGLQGDHPKYWMTASLMKHFLANSNEDGRDSTSSDFDERLWREYYSYPFWKGVTVGGSRAYMAAYNAHNGIPCHIHPMLENITVKEWGQNGIICTDGGGLRLLVTSHKEFPDVNQASAACIESGINQFLDNYREGVYAALANGYIKEQDIDSVIRGNFRVMIKLGLLDPPEMVPYSQIGKDSVAPWFTSAHKQTALEVTKKSIVLLKNSGNLLPADKNKIKSIAVIGPFAKDVLFDWYSGSPSYSVGPLDGIKNRTGDKIRVLYSPGTDVDSSALIAQQADLVILCVGNHPTCYDSEWAKCPVPSNGKEAVDRKAITLEQEELVKKIYDANKNLVVVLISSFPYAINWTQENVPAILHVTHSSQELGNALADVIFGDYNPAGRLVQTWPRSMDQLPPMMDYNIRNGRTYMYFKGEPLYPFGYGLSYTTFAYSGLKTGSSKLKKDGQIMVTVDVTNTGKRDGDEVVQMYVSHENSKVERPVKELKGFTRVFLKAGETKKVQLVLHANDLAYWDIQQHRFVVENEKINLLIGSSSSDIKLQKKMEVTD